MAIFAVIEPGMKLAFGVRTATNSWGMVRVEHILEWSKPMYVVLSASIQDDLSTKLEILINGEISATNLIPMPLFVVNNPRDYESYQNRSHADESAGLEMGISAHLMCG